MLRIRLFRGGKKHQPSYKIVVVDKDRAPRGGRFIDILGFLNPTEKTKSIDGEKAKHWISKGAQPSDTIHNLLVKEGIIKDKKRDVHKKSKNPPKADQPEAGKPAETPETK
ncbi:30S ribosomal protein S16 [Patescibacteria group bacterium]|nr:30S ribosomal protein S16 [Patescibacteria group bacterium]